MKHSLLFVLFVTLVHAGMSQNDGLYDQGTIQAIEIFFGQSNWDALMDQQMATTEDNIEADSVRINGITFEQVGVKYNANSSYNANNTKNPLHIELDYLIDQDYQQYTDIKFRMSVTAAIRMARSLGPIWRQPLAGSMERG